MAAVQKRRRFECRLMMCVVLEKMLGMKFLMIVTVPVCLRCVLCSPVKRKLCELLSSSVALPVNCPIGKHLYYGRRQKQQEQSGVRAYLVGTGRLAGGVERVSAQSHDGTASDDAQDNSFAVAFRRHLSPRGAREIVSPRPQHPTFPVLPTRRHCQARVRCVRSARDRHRRRLWTSAIAPLSL